MKGTICYRRQTERGTRHGCHRSRNRGKIIQGQGNVREFYSGSGKIGILKKSQGKLKL